MRSGSSGKGVLVAVAVLGLAVIAPAQNPTSPSPAELLLERFQSTKIFSQQLEVAKQIVKSGDARVLQKLEPSLADEDRHLRGNVAFIFASLGDDRGIEVLRAMLEDRSDRPLGQGIPSASFNLAPAWWLQRQIRADRYYAVHLLGEMRNARAVDLLVPMLADDDLNYKVAWALGEIRDRRAIAPLIEALRHKRALVRVSAIQALVKLRATEAVPHLRALLHDTALPSAGEQVPVSDTANAAIAKLQSER